MKTPNKIEFGDFQTPLPLAREICALLKREGVETQNVLEPTCGLGAFLVAAAEAFPAARLTGLEINAGYLEAARESLERAGAVDRTSLRSQDFFANDWDKELAAIPGSLLVLGNPRG